MTPYDQSFPTQENVNEVSYKNHECFSSTVFSVVITAPFATVCRGHTCHMDRQIMLENRTCITWIFLQHDPFPVSIVYL